MHPCRGHHPIMPSLRSVRSIITAVSIDRCELNPSIRSFEKSLRTNRSGGPCLCQ
jgi:hypothetical protein